MLVQRVSASYIRTDRAEYVCSASARNILPLMFFLIFIYHFDLLSDISQEL